MRTVFLFLIIPFLSLAQSRIAIIGGGIAGVSTAHFLSKVDSNSIISVFEKKSQVGGNANTIKTMNKNGDTLYIDAGPQYFADKSWENYIALLKEYNEYNDNETYAFNGTIVLKQEGNNRPNIVTPLHGKFRGEKLKTLLQFKKLFDKGYDIFSGKNVDYPPTIGQWVEQLPFDQKFINDVIFPFLAADLGTSTQQIKEVATSELVRLFAFRKPKSSSEYKIMKWGMGTLIQNIASKIENNKIHFQTASPVHRVVKSSNEFEVYFMQHDSMKMEKFDFVLFATHPYQAAKIIEKDTALASLTEILTKLDYFKVHIVIHTFDQIVDSNYASFFNIHIDKQTNMISNTMNLGMIHSRYSGIYKSWVNDSVFQFLKEKQFIIHDEYFYHPLINIKFVENIATLKIRNQQFPNLYFAGGWSQRLETQETAILSAKEAVQHYLKWKQSQIK